MDKPLVSVMMPTFNQVNFVREALLSAVQQDYPNLEVVVSDDGSTDGTIGEILEIAQLYPDRVIAIVEGKHLGITKNCNRSLVICKGKYVAFHAGDDVFLPGKISRQVVWMEEDERRVLCGHDIDVFNSDTGKSLFLWSRRYKMRNGDGPELVVRHGVPYGGVSIMVRTNVLPAYGFDERLTVVSDWKLWVDCLSAGGRFGYLDDVYARYRRHQNNITSSGSDQLFTDQMKALSYVELENPYLVDICKFRRARLNHEHGVDLILSGKRNLARKYFTTAIQMGCWNYWKTHVGFLLTFLPDRFNIHFLKTMGFS